VGAAGLRVLDDHAGRDDGYGNELSVTAPAVADELAGAAELVMGKVDAVPVALVRGLERALSEGSAAELVRAAATDMFR